MAKASAPGRTKTRLVPPLTFDEAAAFNTAFLRDVADNIVAASKHQPIAGYAAFGPPGPQSTAFFRNLLPSDFGLLEAWHANFGRCLYDAIDQMLGRGHRAAVVLNSDSPTLPTTLLVRTAALLAEPSDHAVLGPSVDGGYYLLGVKHRHRRLFDDIAWSTERVAAQTMQRAHEIGLQVHVLPEWYDVDDVDTLKTLQAELSGGPTFSTEFRIHPARHSAQLIRSLIMSADLMGRVADLGGAHLQRALG
jgi:rSAM/selenodomain-associated transferase 1